MRRDGASTDPTLYTRKQAAVYLGISPTRVRQYQDRGVLPAVIDRAGRYLSTADDLKRLRARLIRNKAHPGGLAATPESIAAAATSLKPEERQRLMRFFREGETHVGNIVEATGIDWDVVRYAYQQWKTAAGNPIAMPEPVEVLDEHRGQKAVKHSLREARKMKRKA